MFRLLKFARFGKKQESDPVWYRHSYTYKSYLELLRRYVLSPKKHIKKFRSSRTPSKQAKHAQKKTHAQHMNKNTQPS